MCMMSVVHDHFNKEFDSFPGWPPIGPDQPTTPFDFNKFLILDKVSISKAELEALQKLIKDFRSAVEAAAKLDVLMKTPDCVDPEKAKLQERVLFLEKMVDELLTRK